MSPHTISSLVQTSKFARLGFGQANISNSLEGTENFLGLTSQTRLFPTLIKHLQRYASTTVIVVSVFFVLCRAIWYLVCCVTPESSASSASEESISLLALSRRKTNNNTSWWSNTTDPLKFHFSKTEGQELKSKKDQDSIHEAGIEWLNLALWAVSLMLLVISLCSGTFADTASDFDACLKFHQLGNAVKFQGNARFRSLADSRIARRSPREIFCWTVHWLYVTTLAICARVATPVVAAILRGRGSDGVISAATSFNWTTFLLCFIIIELGGWAMKGPVATGPHTPSLFLGLAETSPMFRGLVGIPVALIKLRKFLKLGALQTSFDPKLSVLSKGVIILEGASLSRKFFAHLGHAELAATRRQRSLSDPMAQRKRRWTNAWRFFTPQWWLTTFQAAVEKACDILRAMPVIPGMVCILCASIPTAVHEMLVQNMEVCMAWVGGEYSLHVCNTLAVLAGDSPPEQGCRPPQGDWQKWIHPFPDLATSFLDGTMLWWLCTLPVLMFLLHKEVLGPALTIKKDKKKQKLN